ncbi:MAG TPA: toxin TcdB middle/N-terminal domain-containing protein, partial [Steroidobacteraceae bacterium]|nr:toxin TcdB middle/N-terminal domain-containing protein [Steroidobacteraceae bacterium]
MPVVVPPYHGIEPQLAIAYSSAAGNGIMGVGWSLQGLSEIEKVDQHLELDGQWLVACLSQTDVFHGPDKFGPRSPGCESALGWYSTLQETYVRVMQSPTIRDGLAVWRPNGVRIDYARVAGRPKYLITTVTDPSGNVVQYNWNTVAGFGFDFLDSITYNGTVIKFYYEPRRLNETYAEFNALDVMSLELVTIDVCVNAPGVTTPCGTLKPDAHRARAYALTYVPSSQTLRPLLTTLTMFGKDALLDKNGVVHSGHATPAYTFSWSSAAPAYTSTDIGAIPDWGHDWIGQMVDFNGDGRADYCRDVGGGPNTWNMKCAMSTGNGLIDEWKGYIWNWGDDNNGAWVDWDGDGKTDYCRIANHAIWCAFSVGTAGNVTAINDMQVGAPLASGDEGSAGMRWWVDWNQDGRADYCRGVPRLGGNHLYCAMSVAGDHPDYRDVDMGALFDQAGGPPDTSGEVYSRAIVDFNGDGAMDFCRIVAYNGQYQMWCNLGSRAIDGDRNRYVGAVPTLMGTISDIGWPDSQWWVDVNGDGKTDYCRLTKNGDIRCAISHQDCGGAVYCDTNGHNAFEDVVWAHPADPGDPDTRRFADINGDGKADFCTSAGGTVTCLISAGTTALPVAFTGAPNQAAPGRAWMVDWLGDGRAEYCGNTSHPGGGSQSMLTCVRRNPGLQVDVMTAVNNGIGGTTSIAYVPSANWRMCPQGTDNNPPTVPTVSSITTPDGTTSYLYCGGQYDHWLRRFLGFGWARA